MNTKTLLGILYWIVEHDVQIGSAFASAIVLARKVAGQLPPDFGKRYPRLAHAAVAIVSLMPDVLPFAHACVGILTGRPLESRAAVAAAPGLVEPPASER